MARVYEDAGRYDAAVEAMKHAVPNYFAMDLPTLPRSYWEALFPKPYWPDVKKFSSQNALDPYLVTSLIRQESEFNPNALSRKDAVGLMQLLPKVGKGVAKQQKIKHFSTQQLFTPGMNLQLGTRSGKRIFLHPASKAWGTAPPNRSAAKWAGPRRSNLAPRVS